MCCSESASNDCRIASTATGVFRLWQFENPKGGFKVQWRTKGLLIVSSLVNAAIGYFSFWVMVFATSPHMDDVTMRVGFYVVNLITVSALAATIVPWIFANRSQNKIAALFAMLPVLLIGLAILAFLTLDNWLNRTFSGRGVPSFAATMVGQHSPVWPIARPDTGLHPITVNLVRTQSALFANRLKP